MAYFVETAKLKLLSKKPREVNSLGASCCKCGGSEGQKLTIREERVGCIVSPFTYCQPCLMKIEHEESAFEYQRSHFCNRCNVKFDKPYRKTRRSLMISEGFHTYFVNLCPKCHESEAVKYPKQKIYEDVFGDSNEATSNSNPWS